MLTDITTTEQFKDYILSRLGYPVITVELDRNTHLNAVIDDALLEMQRYGFGEGTFKDYIRFDLVSGTNLYNISGSEVASVTNFISEIGSVGSINVLFTPTNMLLSGQNFARNITNFGLMDYVIAMMYLKEIMNTFSITYNLSYRANTGEILVVPTPKENLTGIIEVYKKETVEHLFNNILFRDLVVSKAKIIWGIILGKYSVTIPGGVTLNGPAIEAAGKEEYNIAIDKIKSESEQAAGIMIFG